jgi:hypothetical protein
MIVSSTEAVQYPGPQQDPEEDQRQRVEGVVEGDEGDHPAGDVAAGHAGFAQSPVGEGDAAGAAGREEQGGRDPRHVDLVGLGPGQPQGVPSHHGLEEGDVGGVGEDVEADRDRDPDRIGFPQLAHRVAEADELGEEEVDADEQHQDDDDRLDQPPRGEQRHLDGPAAVRRVGRHARDATRSRSSPDAAVSG